MYTITVSREEVEKALIDNGVFKSNGNYTEIKNIDETFTYNFELETSYVLFLNWIGLISIHMSNSHATKHHTAHRKSKKYNIKVRGRSSSDRFRGYPEPNESKIKKLVERMKLESFTTHRLNFKPIIMFPTIPNDSCGSIENKK